MNVWYGGLQGAYESTRKYSRVVRGGSLLSICHFRDINLCHIKVNEWRFNTIVHICHNFPKISPVNSLCEPDIRLWKSIIHRGRPPIFWDFLPTLPPCSNLEPIYSTKSMQPPDSLSYVCLWTTSSPFWLRTRTFFVDDPFRPWKICKYDLQRASKGSTNV